MRVVFFCIALEGPSDVAGSPFDACTSNSPRIRLSTCILTYTDKLSSSLGSIRVLQMVQKSQ